MLEQRFVEIFFYISVLTLCRRDAEIVQLCAGEMQKLYNFGEMIAAVTSDIF